jgi:hypothetical protein
MDWLNYANQGATRNQPIAPELAQAMRFLPEMGITMDVFSGGQPAQGSGGARVGSVRHDDGGSADVFFSQNGRRLDWANPDDVPIYQDIVRRARANGVTGFGAGDGYMQPGSMHVGFGNPAVWGAGGRGTNAPEWLRTAFDGATAGTQARVSTSNVQTPNTNNAQTGGILSNEGNQMAQQPQGLLGSMGIQRRDPTAQGETSQPFYNRQSFGDTLARMAPALGRMGVMGLEGPAQAALDTRNERQGDERAQAAQAAQRNQTIEWLVNNGREDLAGAVQSGGLPIGEAMSLAMAPPEAYSPNSSIGKLQQDLQNGSISQEQFDLGLANMAPSGMEISSDGDGGFTLVQGPGAGSGSGGTMTEGQSKDAVYATRAAGALDILDPIANSLTNVGMGAANIDPTGVIRGAVQSPEYQMAAQAGQEFLQAILRKDTGAAITPSEENSYGQVYLPRPGDGEAVLAQKQLSRRRALEALMAGMSPDAMLAQERALLNTNAGNTSGATPPPAGGNGGARTRYDAEGNRL